MLATLVRRAWKYLNQRTEGGDGPRKDDGVEIVKEG
jgi:hypothetical protein